MVKASHRLVHNRRPCLGPLPSFHPTFPRLAAEPRYKWFVKNHGDRCWELDAMDPNELRDCVEGSIRGLIEPTAWARCEVVNRAEQHSLQTILKNWAPPHDD